MYTLKDFCNSTILNGKFKIVLLDVNAKFLQEVESLYHIDELFLNAEFILSSFDEKLLTIHINFDRSKN